jgi:hypothetical protein
MYRDAPTPLVDAIRRYSPPLRVRDRPEQTALRVVTGSFSHIETGAGMCGGTRYHTMADATRRIVTDDDAHWGAGPDEM